MRGFIASLLMIGLTGSLCAQQDASNRISSGATSLSESANLPVAKIGKDDLIGITVYDAPELTRTVRVSSEGEIRLPMLQHHIQAAGLFPAELETAITNALVKENVLVDPIVTVSVVEYRSRSISVSGAVKKPVTFQATGTVTLLDAISEAEGLAENAGAEILITRPGMDPGNQSTPSIQRIPVFDLLSAENPALNVLLEGGEQIRVPEAGRVFVVGDVKKPGAFYITDGAESSVMKALSLSEGLDSFPSHTAYIYRKGSGGGPRNEIPINLKKIIDRKSPDVPLMANDIFYIPSATGLRASLKVLEETVGAGAALGAAAIYVYH